MSLDTKHRPTRYADVLGQDATKTILRQFVATGKGFEQSYLFAGPYGSGKTTLGRILARALLCDAPVDGEPCDQCPSCLDMLKGAVSETFTEVDAATNSGKADVQRITEELQYQSFSGKRKLYLFDESHQLSKEALDALLKPLEENLQGSSDKKLVCIFCTTEPEKMRATILSRCAPAFVIKPLSPTVISDRLVEICDAESIEHDKDALTTIAEWSECHIRDSIKAVEGVRMLGPVTLENVRTYLDLDVNDMYLTLLEQLSTDLKAAMETTAALSQRVSPATAYVSLANLSMQAYQMHLGVDALDSYWDKERVTKLSERGSSLLNYATRFSSRSSRPSMAMLKCDVASLYHLQGSGITASDTVVIVSQTQTTGETSPADVTLSKEKGVESLATEPKTLPNVGKLQATTELRGAGVHVDRRAIRAEGQKPSADTETFSSSDLFDAPEFCRLLGKALAKQSGVVGGSTGRTKLDNR